MSVGSCFAKQEKRVRIPSGPHKLYFNEHPIIVSTERRSIMDGIPEERLSKIRFRMVFNVRMAHTFLGAQINKLDLATDREGNLLPDIVGAICVMLRSAPGSEYWDPRDASNYRSMLEFLDPYLLPPYRPQSNELPVVLYQPRHY